jgi:hypothetical protein
MAKSTVGDLRAELGELEQRLRHAKRQHDEAVEERKTLARGIVAGDAKVLKRDGVLAETAALASRTVEAILTLRADAEQRLEKAEVEEADKLCQARAAEAEAFATQLAARGAEFDRFLRLFREGVIALKEELAVARSKGLLHASGKAIEVAISQAVRTALWCSELAELTIGAPDVRHTFEHYTRSWADAVRGQVHRRLNEPVATPTKVDKPQQSWPSALIGDADDDNFTVYDTKADADRAHQQMQKGPNNGIPNP